LHAPGRQILPVILKERDAGFIVLMKAISRRAL
jgi:hypothetical protein